MRKERGDIMRDEYDLENMVQIPNPYPDLIAKKQITIRLESPIIVYFKNMAEEMGIPYQVLINMYLADCVKHKRKLKISWEEDDE